MIKWSKDNLKITKLDHMIKGFLENSFSFIRFTINTEFESPIQRNYISDPTQNLSLWSGHSPNDDSRRFRKIPGSWTVIGRGLG